MRVAYFLSFRKVIDMRNAIKNFGVHRAYGIEEQWNESNHDMTLRDYFAAKAMQGLLAHPNCRQLDDDVCRIVAKEAYLTADAMLEARKK